MGRAARAVRLRAVRARGAGGSRGEAELLAREAARVILNGRTEPRVAAAMARLRESVPGANVSGVAADVGTAAGLRFFEPASVGLRSGSPMGPPTLPLA